MELLRNILNINHGTYTSFKQQITSSFFMEGIFESYLYRISFLKNNVFVISNSS